MPDWTDYAKRIDLALAETDLQALDVQKYLLYLYSQDKKEWEKKYINWCRKKGLSCELVSHCPCGLLWAAKGCDGTIATHRKLFTCYLCHEDTNVSTIHYCKIWKGKCLT